MANIKISDLQATGYELFSDFESFLSDLSDNELQITGGGFTNKTWHWTSVIPSSGLGVYTAYALSTKHDQK